MHHDGVTTHPLELRDLRKSYGRRRAVDGITCTVARGEIVGLLGPNGAGKSTTMSLLTGLLSPSSGEILWEGQSIHDRLPQWRRMLGAVMEDLALFEYLTVEEHLTLMARLAGLDSREADRRRGELLSFFDLEDHADTPAAEASQGTRRKLAFALGLVHSPRVLLLDEALNGIDAITVSRIKGLLRRMAAAGVTIILSSHILDAAQTLVGRVMIVDKGRIVLDTTMDALRASGRTLEEVYTATISPRAAPELTWAV